MGKHVRTLIGEGAPPPWVPFGIKHPSATAGWFCILFYFLLFIVIVHS
jgi:hypothetical protein